METWKSDFQIPYFLFYSNIILSYEKRKSVKKKKTTTTTENPNLGVKLLTTWVRVKISN